MIDALACPARLADRVSHLSGVRRTLVAGVLGALSVLGFAPLHIWPVLFVCFGGLVWLLDGCLQSRASLRNRFACAAWIGFWFGFGFFLTGLYWIAEAFLVEPWRHGWLIPFVMTALPGGMALFFAAGCAIAMMFWRPGPGRIFALGLGLGLTELVRGFVLTGFPWNQIGYGLLANAPLMQLASLLGVSALTVLAIALFSSPAAIWNGGGSRSRGAALVAGLFLAALAGGYVWGEARLAGAPKSADGIRIRLVQANIPQAEKWRPENTARIFETYLRMTQRPGLEDIGIVVWPETALPFPLDTSPAALAAIGAVLPENTALMTGSARWAEDRGPDGTFLGRRAYNSLLSINGAGKIVSVYDKMHLVPFGEFLPFQDFLESLGIMQLTGVRGGFSAGIGPRLLDVPNGPPALPLICYEIIFPEEVRPQRSGDSATARPGWILNVTNDAWFGSSFGPYQHFHQARVRAVELGLPLVRVANTGISAITGPWGRIRTEIELGHAAVTDGMLPAPAPETLYARLGPFSALLAIAFVIAGIGTCWFCADRRSNLRKSSTLTG